ncbi:MAG: DNA recombination protein RmuC [Bacteroidales bacterium]|nr:DNA recombination protein RmuC [Bacteroidales bacterium]
MSTRQRVDFFFVAFLSSPYYRINELNEKEFILLDIFVKKAAMTEILALIVGIAIGATGVYFILKSRFSGLKMVSDERINLLQVSINELKKNNEDKEQALFTLNGQYNSKLAEYKALELKLSEQKKEIDDLQQRFTVEFKNLANEILEDKSKRFTEQNKINLNEILKPLNEKIKDFEKKVEETYDKESQQRFSLKEEVKRLAELNQQISREANNLTKALKGEAKSQGMWGEIILEGILEKSGLVKNREYFIQESFRGNDEKRLQPDVILKYPGDRNVIVDSKVSLTAFERYISEEDEQRREIALKEHLTSVRRHIQELSAKNYQDLYQLNSLDFVMMFLPVEPAYMLAIQFDPEIWQYAYDRRILIISPTNLIAALKMIVSLWRQENQNKNALEIARRSGELYDKFVGLIDDLIDVGNKLKQTQKSYEASMNKLTLGKGSIVKRAQDLRELGVKSKKDLPQNILDRAEMDENLQ